MSKEVKYIKFKNLMEELKYLEDFEDLPRRDDSKYCGNDKIKGIEHLDIYEFNSCIVFEMAHRNKDVVAIINKLDYIEELIQEYPYLESGNDILFKPINSNLGNDLRIIEDDNNEEQLPTIAIDLEKEYINIGKLPLSEFQEELYFLVDTGYSDNYNENWYSDMVKDGIDDPFKITEELNQQYMLKDPTGKALVEDNCLSRGKLNIIIYYLQDELMNEFFIYPNGYCQEENLSCKEKVISKEMITHSAINLQSTNEQINSALIEFRKLKPTDMKAVADYFFIYDYYKKRIEDGSKTLIAQDIKFALTKYHGVKIKETKEVISYDDCLERYDEYINLDAEFHIVERAIRTKIKFMEDFIDIKYYKYIVSS